MPLFRKVFAHVDLPSRPTDAQPEKRSDNSIKLNSPSKSFPMRLLHAAAAAVDALVVLPARSGSRGRHLRPGHRTLAVEPQVR